MEIIMGKLSEGGGRRFWSIESFGIFSGRPPLGFDLSLLPFRHGPCRVDWLKTATIWQFSIGVKRYH